MEGDKRDDGVETSGVDNAERLGDALVESLRHMGSFSQRSLKYFDEVSVSAQLSAKRMPPIPNMLISRMNFRADIRAEYDRVAVGQMRQVVAATGVGKSTLFPAEVCSFTGTNGLILSPRADLSYFNGAYLAEKYLKVNYPGLQAVQLRSEHAKLPVSGKVLYYDSAASFFMMWAIYPSLLRKLNIKFILFDESHEQTAEYKLAELLASAGKFSEVKVLQVSATRGDVNMEGETQGNLRKVVPTAVDLMDLSNVDSLTKQSPLHYSRINSKALIFVSELSTIAAAQRYYNQQDIPVFVYTSASSSTLLPKLQEFLSEHRVAVVLTDRILDTGFTFDVDDCYDCGYTTELVLDLDDKRVEIVKKPVTLSQRMQRGGRIGRLRPGTFYYADLESSPATPGLSDSSACYLALWCKLYNLSTNLPDIVRFKTYFGNMTHRKVMMLLHCHVHPILTNPYMDMEGNMCHGWEKVFNHAMRKASFDSSELRKTEQIEAEWVHQNVCDERFLDELDSIKVPLTVPEIWSPFFYAVWKVTNDADQKWPFDSSFDRRSVLSVVPLDASSRKKSVFRSRHVRDSSATLALDAKVVGRIPIRQQHVVSPVLEESLDFDRRQQRALSGVVNKPLPVIQAVDGVQRQAIEFDAIPSPSVSSVKMTSTDSKRRSVAFVRTSSDVSKAPVQEIHSPGSSHDLSGYRRVKASALHFEKVFPHHSELLHAYVDSPARRDVDVSRVDDMCDFRVKVHDLNTDVQAKNVLSLVRCWNYNIVAASQHAAKQDRRPSLFRTTSKVAANIDRDLESFRQLMATMELEGFRFCVKSSGRHSGSPKIKYPTDSLVADRVDYVKAAVRVLSVDGTRRGIYLFDEGCALGVLHVFEVDDKLERLPTTRFVRIARKDDLVILSDVREPVVGILQLVRPPVPLERVYVVTVLESGRYTVVDDVQVAESHGRWFHTAEGVPGMSGAAIVAEDDGKLVGLHLGASTVYSAYKSAMVALSAFVLNDA